MQAGRYIREATREVVRRRSSAFRRSVALWISGFAALGAVALLVGVPASGVRAASADPSLVGQWTAPFNIGVRAIHANVLHNGKLLLFSYPVTAVGSDAFVWDPSTNTSTNVSLNWPRDIFCAGHAFLPDGRLLITGGHVHNAAYGLGIANTDIFDPASNTFSPGPLLSQARWYPSSIETGNGHVLTFGGSANKTTQSNQVDDYNPATNSITTLPPSANRQVNEYPRLHLLWNGRISATNQARTYLFDPATNKWTASALPNYGGRGENDSSILLPGGKRVLEFGGTTSGAVTATAEIIDFSSPTPQWRAVGSLNFARLWSNAVQLPDGTVLAVGGGSGGQYTNPVYTPELFDPATETWTTLATQTAPRIYHSTAVLLPDGRVFSAGMDHGAYQATAEIFSPPYLFKGPRPTISSAPSDVTYGSSFQISTPDAGSVTRAVLVRPGSVTHSINTDQRLVDLTVTGVGANTLSATAPADGNQAPPGWYMLFLLNGNGVPSVASWVHVGPGAPPVPTVSGFAPASGIQGSTVDVTGTGFTGTSSVTFGGTAAVTYSVISDTELTATVPSGASSGPIAVTTPGGSATSPASFTVTPLLSYRDTVLGDTPAGYWRLSELSGAAVDQTGNAAGGVYNGGVTLGVPGALATDSDTAAAFDGTTAWLSVPNNTALGFGDTFSYEAWFKRTATQGTAQRLIAKGVGPTLGFGGNNKLVLIPGGVGATAVTTSTIAITDQNWHAVVVTKSGPAVHLYIDGVDRTGPITNTTFAPNTQPLVIGRGQSTSGYFSGSIDEVAVYATALTPQQVQTHFKAATG